MLEELFTVFSVDFIYVRDGGSNYTSASHINPKESQTGGDCRRRLRAMRYIFLVYEACIN